MYCAEIHLYDWFKLVKWLSTKNQGALLQLCYSKICLWYRHLASTFCHILAPRWRECETTCICHFLSFEWMKTVLGKWKLFKIPLKSEFSIFIFQECFGVWDDQLWEQNFRPFLRLPDRNNNKKHFLLLTKNYGKFWMFGLA